MGQQRARTRFARRGLQARFRRLGGLLRGGNAPRQFAGDAALEPFKFGATQVDADPALRRQKRQKSFLTVCGQMDVHLLRVVIRYEIHRVSSQYLNSAQ